MNKSPALFTAAALVLLSAAASAAPLPAEIYRPAGAHTVKADRQGDGEFEYEARLSARGTSVPALARKATAHARSKGFRVVESEIKHDDADLKFKRGDQELDISIERKSRDRIEYKADLDLDKN